MMQNIYNKLNQMGIHAYLVLAVVVVVMAFSSLEAQSPSAHSARHPSLVRVPHPDLFSPLLSYPYHVHRDRSPHLFDPYFGGLAHRDDGSLVDPGRAYVHPYLFHSHVCLYLFFWFYHK
jgi:hypothetical protein